MRFSVVGESWSGSYKDCAYRRAQVHQKFKLMAETLFLSVHLLDRSSFPLNNEIYVVRGRGHPELLVVCCYDYRRYSREVSGGLSRYLQFLEDNGLTTTVTFSFWLCYGIRPSVE